jgi:predicted outer membrane repeat protein
LGLTYNKLTIGGATATGVTQFAGNNPFSEIAYTKPVAHTLSFAAGSTNTVGAWTITGTAGNVVTLRSTTGGTHNLVKTGGGAIATDYMSITDSSATPSSTWYAGNNSTNVSNNSGWIFGALYISSIFELSTVTDATSVAPSVFNVQLADSATATDSIIGAYPWDLIDDSQNPNWQNINTA